MARTKLPNALAQPNPAFSAVALLHTRKRRRALNFFQCSSCLSRACHGKSQRNDRFNLKQENGGAKTARSHLAGNDTARKPASDHALASAALCQPLPLSQLLPPMMKLESTLAVGCIPPKHNATLFKFLYVCPEPVLVKSSFLCINGSKGGVFRTGS